MNDRYLFRGKRKDNGEWIEGNLINCAFFNNDGFPIFYILDIDNIEYDCWEDIAVEIRYLEVIPETVGQCTGLKDKNGKLIFEGDIVYCKSRLDNANMVIIFECGQFRMVLSENYRSYQTNSGSYDINCFDKEVIGNIHDNSLEDFRSER